MLYSGVARRRKVGGGAQTFSKKSEKQKKKKKKVSGVQAQDSIVAYNVMHFLLYYWVMLHLY